MIYLCLFTHMRFKWLLVPGLSVTVSFATSTLIGAQGSGTSMAMPVAKSISQALLIVFAFAGQRQIEYTRRRAFVLKLEAETQRIALEKEKEYSRHKAQKNLKTEDFAEDFVR